MFTRPTLLIVIFALSGCLGNEYRTHSTVYTNGSVKRTISSISRDSLLLRKNIFGVRKENAWAVEINPIPGDTTDKRVTVSLTKLFQSAEDANQEMYSPPDSQFKIRAEFESTFWWFYTDYDYSDTYPATVRFNHVKPDDFFTQEDYDFADRTRGPKPLTEKDSLYKATYDIKLENYISRGFFEEILALTVRLEEKKSPGSHWPDSTLKHKERLYRALMVRDFHVDHLEAFLKDSLKIPIQFSEEERELFQSVDGNAFLDLFDTFSHSIEMPADIVECNADSTAGAFAYWGAQGNMIREYTMHVKARRPNYLAIIATVFLIAAAIFARRVWESTRIRKSES